jgi:hypothetical protein
MPGKHISLSLIIALIISSFYSCDIINPPEPKAAYLEVDTIMVNNTTGLGGNFHGIEDIWVYVNGQLVGTYEAPFTVPVLPSGEQQLTLEAGVKESGQSSFHVIYPFMTSYSSDTTLPPGDTLHINPVFQYADPDVAFFEDFEDLGTGFEITAASDTALQTVNDSNCLDGQCGYFANDISRPNFDCRTAEVFPLPKDSKIFAEVSYMCTQEFTVGVFAKEYTGEGYSDVRYPILTLFESPEWNTVYINLTDIVAETTNAVEYRLFISAQPMENNENFVSGEVYLDNIKILHY